jgi:hypothetical protein
MRFEDMLRGLDVARIDGVNIIVNPHCPAGTIYAICDCDAGLPSYVEAMLAAMPDGPEKVWARFVELARRGYVVVGRNEK